MAWLKHRRTWCSVCWGSWCVNAAFAKKTLLSATRWSICTSIFTICCTMNFRMWSILILMERWAEPNQWLARPLPSNIPIEAPFWNHPVPPVHPYETIFSRSPSRKQTIWSLSQPWKRMPVQEWPCAANSISAPICAAAPRISMAGWSRLSFIRPDANTDCIAFRSTWWDIRIWEKKRYCLYWTLCGLDRKPMIHQGNFP